MPKVLLLIVTLCFVFGMLYAGIADYMSFSAGTQTYTEITGTAVSGAMGDDVVSDAIDLGFTFPYCGSSYTQVKVSSNGYVGLGSTVGSAAANALSSTSICPIMAPLWDDLHCGRVANATYPVTSSVQYLLSGTAPNRSFTVQWKNAYWLFSSSTCYCDFQVVISENGSFYYSYGSHTGTPSASASIGCNTLPGGVGNYFSITPSTGTASSTAENGTITAHIASNTKYSFTPFSVMLLSPLNGATNVSVSGVLSWQQMVTGTLGYRLSLGTDNPPTSLLNSVDAGNVTSYALPANTPPFTLLRWSVVPYTASGDLSNVPVWSFTTAHLQFTGIKTINPAGSGDNNYTTFTAAINALNVAGVGTGGVTFMVQDGATFTENLPAITVNGTAANPIVFQRSGGGVKPILYAGVGTGTTDAVVTLKGCDYVTWNGIDIAESAANSTSTTQAEYGIYLTNASTTDGAQHNTVMNTVITLRAGYANGKGVYDYYNTTYNPAGATGADSYNHFYNNTVSAWYGYYLYAYNTGAEGMGNEVGITTGGTASISGCVYGVYGYYQRNFKVFSQNITLTGGAAASVSYGMYAGGSTTTAEIYDNNVTQAVAATVSNSSFGVDASSISSASVYNNTISNISSAYYVYGLYISTGTTVTSSFYGNVITNLSTTAAYSAYGIYVYAGNNNVYGNQISTITAAAAGAYGVYINGGTTCGMYANRITNISYTGAGSNQANGICVNAGTNNYVYNNMILDIKAPSSTSSPCIRGLALTSGTNNYVYNNTVYLNASGTTAGFSSAALYVSITSGTSDLKNNIFVNMSTPGSTGKAVAFWKSNTTFAYITNSSNRNIYYAGIPSASTPIYYDGTNTYAELAAYKAAAGGVIDAGSYSENVPFISTSSPYDLHINASVPTYVEGNALVITAPVSVSTDIDGQTRSVTLPDIGADEGAFTTQITCTTPVAQPVNLALVPASTTVNGSFSPAIPAADRYLVLRHTAATLTSQPLDGAYYAVGATLGNATVVSVNGTSFTASGLATGTLYHFTVMSYNIIGNGAPKYLTASPLTGNVTTLPSAPANPASFTATPYNHQQINLAATSNAAGSSILIAYNSENVFGTPLSTTNYIAGASLAGGGTILYKGTAGALTPHTGLTPNTTVYYKAWSYDTSGIYCVYSSGMTASATTSSPPLTAFPWLEHFTSWPPVGWSVNSGTYSWVHYTTTGSWACANLWGQSNGNTDILITPPLLFSSDMSVGFKWSHIYNSVYPSDALTLQISNNGVTWTDLWSRTGSAFNSADGATYSTPGTGVWTSVPIPSSYTNSVCYLRFYAFSGYGPNVYIDLVSVFGNGGYTDYGISGLTATPLYKMTGSPVILTASVSNTGLSTAGATVTFYADGLSIGTVNTGIIATNATVTASLSHVFMTEGLHNITASLSDDADNANNTSAVLPITLYLANQLAEGMEDTTFPPFGWRTSGTAVWSRGSTTGSAYDGSGYATVVLTSASTDSRLITPQLYANGSLTFRAKASATGNNLLVEYSATPTGPWTALGTAYTLTTAYAQYTANLAVTGLETAYIAFKAVPSSSGGTVYLDNVIGTSLYISNMLNPVVMTAPANAATGVSPLSVVLDWEEAPLIGGVADGYAVFISNNRTAIFDQYYFDVYAPTTQFSPYADAGLLLDYNTVWYWLVYPYNGPGNPNPDDCPIWSFTTTPRMRVGITNLNLGRVWTGTVKTGTIPVINEGDTTLTFTASGGANLSFTTATIAPHTTYDMPFAYSVPVTIGTYSGNIAVSSPQSPTVTIAYSATVVSDVTVGTGTSNLNLPVNPYYNYSYSQSIYYPTEVVYPADYRINKLYYYWNGYETAEVTKSYVIYMGNTTRSVFANSSDWEPVANLTQVFSGDVIPQAHAGGYWMEIDLTTPFVYNGTGNLIIAVDENCTGYDTVNSCFYSTTSTSNRSLEFHSDTTNPSPASPPTGILKAGFPNIMLGVEPIPLPPTLSTPVLSSFTREGNNLTLHWSAVTGAVSYIVSASAHPTDGFTTLGQVSTTTYTTPASATCRFYRITATTAALPVGMPDNEPALPAPAQNRKRGNQ